MSFAELLDAIDELQVDEQAELVEIVSHRLSERRRDELAKEIRQARSDFEAGLCSPMTPEEILRDIKPFSVKGECHSRE
jgi:hypothetical protein